ncbi:MAG: hypothetical protein NC911_04190 [Candidatus Omnitrophica bacterium]|nr:hypothetical protein [Candidatus Omnitrophota bacterium]
MDYKILLVLGINILTQGTQGPGQVWGTTGAVISVLAVVFSQPGQGILGEKLFSVQGHPADYPIEK